MIQAAPRPPGWLELARLATLTAGLALASVQAMAQTAPPNEPPPQEEIPVRPEPAPSPTMAPTRQETSGRASSVRALEEGRSLSIKEASGLTKKPPGQGGSVLTEAATGAAVDEGSRVLKVPAACTPKTNSLDCVADAGQAAQGANVSSRVRNSVIGEVGAGRGATEGSGGAKREGPCTPVAGQLNCQ